MLYKYDYWTPENPTNEFARLGSNTKSPSFNVYKNRSYVRLQEVSLAYRIPNKISSKWSVSNARVYINVSNPFIDNRMEIGIRILISGTAYVYFWY